MWFEHSEVWAATMIPTDPSTRESSSMMIEYSMYPIRRRPAPPENRAHIPQAAEFADDFEQNVALVPLHDVRRDFRLGELATALRR